MAEAPERTAVRCSLGPVRQVSASPAGALIASVVIGEVKWWPIVDEDMVATPGMYVLSSRSVSDRARSFGHLAGLGDGGAVT